MVVAFQTPPIVANDTQPRKLTFVDDVLPILTSRCLKCHSGNRPKAGLNLSERPLVMRGGISGPAIRVAAAQSSLLWDRIATGEMPPQGPPLSGAEKGIIRTWINDGAINQAGEDGEVIDSHESDEYPLTESDRNFWSFRPAQHHKLPSVETSHRMRTPVDSFVLHSLQQAGLNLSSEATPETLLRRTTFDLIGLPPTPEEVTDFHQDTSPDAYERATDRLLSSPHYGERWGRHWLDIAGYADSTGVLGADYPLHFMFRYRDYVIQAFNQDKPYDRFLLEQIAGDELVDYHSAFAQEERLSPKIVEALIATGFLRTAPDSSREDFNTIKNVEALYYYPTINDQLKILMSSTLGLTVHCAKCHNHMFDPISQQEYYELQAILMGAYRPKSWIPQMHRRVPEATKSQLDSAKKHNDQLDAEIAERNKAKEVLQSKYVQLLAELRAAELPDSIREDVLLAVQEKAAERTALQSYLSEKFQTLLFPASEDLTKTLSDNYPEYTSNVKTLDAEIASRNGRRAVFDEIRAIYDLPGDVPTPFLHRGDALTPGHLVEPGVVRVVSAPQQFAWDRPTAAVPTSGRRLAFARWLTQPSHPLTARVMTNRIWLHHFGRGIVSTPDDFGRAGELPSHPQLLDWLSIDFAGHRWSVKRLHRHILHSSTYRQQSAFIPATHATASQQDPENKLLWRQRLRRLEAEPIRDSMLFVGGRLRKQIFGRHIPLASHPNGEVTNAPNTDAYRRSIYYQVLRSKPLTMLGAFDQPRMKTNCAVRDQSTVSTQALTVLNSDQTVNAAQAFAAHLESEAAKNPVSTAIRIAYSRAPRVGETETMTAFFESQIKRYQQLQKEAETAPEKAPGAPRFQALTDLCHMLLSSNEFIYID